MEQTKNQAIFELKKEISNIKNRYLVRATENHAGILYPEDKSALIHANGTRLWIYDETNIDDLTAGHYAGYAYNLKGGPYETDDTSDLTVFEIDVTTDTPRKQIVLHYSGRGEYFYKNIHTNSNNNPQSWGVMRREVVLWSGSVSTVGSTIDLSDSLNHYSKIKIAFSSVNPVDKWQELNISSNAQTMTITDINLPNGGGNVVVAYELNLLRSSEVQLKIDSSNGKLIGDGISDDSNRITIHQIVGVR